MKTVTLGSTVIPASRIYAVDTEDDEQVLDSKHVQVAYGVVVYLGPARAQAFAQTFASKKERDALYKEVIAAMESE